MTAFLRVALLAAVSLALASGPVAGQTTRLVDHNPWPGLSTLVTTRWRPSEPCRSAAAPRASVHPQRLLLRLGGVYDVAKDVKPGGGYTWFVTYPYGRYPTAEAASPHPRAGPMRRSLSVPSMSGWV